MTSWHLLLSLMLSPSLGVGEQTIRIRTPQPHLSSPIPTTTTLSTQPNTTLNATNKSSSSRFKGSHGIFSLWSSCVQDGAQLPSRYARHSFPSCGDQGKPTEQALSPCLTIHHTPRETQSLCVVMTDETAELQESSVHWVLVDLPPYVTSIREGFSASNTPFPAQYMNYPRSTSKQIETGELVQVKYPDSVRELPNSKGFMGYRPPCPLFKRQDLQIQVFAMPSRRLSLNESAASHEVVSRMAQDAIAVATLRVWVENKESELESLNHMVLPPNYQEMLAAHRQAANAAANASNATSD